MKMTRRDFIEETLRELSLPFVSGLRFLSGATSIKQPSSDERGWKKAGYLFTLNPGSSLTIKEFEIEILSDERGMRAVHTKDNKQVNRAIEIRKSNEVWVNLLEEWAPQAFLCHLTLLKKEE